VTQLGLPASLYSAMPNVCTNTFLVDAGPGLECVVSDGEIAQLSSSA
jgi:hypothetical protein